jgi:hypothetical protein
MNTTTPSINNMTPETGREVKEDGTIINTADIISTAIDPLGGVTVSNEQQHAIHAGTAYSFSAHGSLLAGGVYVFLGRVGVNQVHFDGMNINMQSGEYLSSL